MSEDRVSVVRSVHAPEPFTTAAPFWSVWSPESSCRSFSLFPGESGSLEPPRPSALSPGGELDCDSTWRRPKEHLLIFLHWRLLPNRFL